jgi:hypothetical protein
MVEEEDEKKGLFSRFRKAAGEVLYGMTFYDTVRLAFETRAKVESLFLLVTMGDLVGVPVLPPYYTLRILPYAVPKIEAWKRSMLREKDIMDAVG